MSSPVGGEATPEADRLLDVPEVARRTTVKPSTLYSWRAAGIGPKSFRLCGRVVYRESVVRAWIDAREAAEAGRYAS